MSRVQNSDIFCHQIWHHFQSLVHTQAPGLFRVPMFLFSPGHAHVLGVSPTADFEGARDKTPVHFATSLDPRDRHRRPPPLRYSSLRGGAPRIPLHMLWPTGSSRESSWPAAVEPGRHGGLHRGLQQASWACCRVWPRLAGILF